MSAGVAHCLTQIAAVGPVGLWADQRIFAWQNTPGAPLAHERAQPGRDRPQNDRNSFL
jgi:hypothetical protein